MRILTFLKAGRSDHTGHLDPCLAELAIRTDWLSGAAGYSCCQAFRLIKMETVKTGAAFDTVSGLDREIDPNTEYSGLDSSAFAG